MRITVHPEKRVELFQTIRRLLGPAEHVSGCCTFRFYLDVMDENSSLLVGEWETESDLNNYLQSDDFAILRGAIRVLSSHSVDSQARVTSTRVDSDDGTDDTRNLALVVDETRKQAF